MKTKIKTTAPFLSVSADEEQPFSVSNINSIPENPENINAEDEIYTMQQYFREISDPNFLSTVSLTELYDTIYQPKTQVIGNFLCAGVYLFAGAPKVGKSFFMAQLGYHVSSGIPYPVHKGAVLYLALEDDYARLQQRLYKMFGMENADEFYFATQAKNLNQGLEGQLNKFMNDRSDTRLIIIDTLQKVREIGGEKFSYASDYEVVASLKKFNAQHNVCILLVHHTRKQTADDCFDNISGTNGLLGAADGAFIMQKEKRTDNNAVLDIVGRDQQDQRLSLQFDRQHCIWKLTKAETELWKETPDPLLAAVAKLVKTESPEWNGSASELIEMLQLEIQPNALTRQLNVGADRLWNDYSIRYGSSRNHAGRKVTLTLIEG